MEKQVQEKEYNFCAECEKIICDNCMEKCDNNKQCCHKNSCTSCNGSCCKNKAIKN